MALRWREERRHAAMVTGAIDKFGLILGVEDLMQCVV
jgi:hypothetical protein